MGSVGHEAQRTEKGDVHIWLEENAEEAQRPLTGPVVSRNRLAKNVERCLVEARGELDRIAVAGRLHAWLGQSRRAWTRWDHNGPPQHVAGPMMFPLPFDDEPPPTPEEREAIWTVNLIIIAFLLAVLLAMLLADYWFLIK